MNTSIKPERIDSYLGQQLDMGMTLGEFAEMVFIEGFVAGEKYSGILTCGHEEHQLN